MAKLCAPVWASKRLSEDSLAYLVNFGLDSIESEPNLIGRWTETVSGLVAVASRPHADIRKAVICCKIDPQYARGQGE
jgi:hypothetical protein